MPILGGPREDAGSARGRIRDWPGAGFATIRSDSTAFPSSCSRRCSISIRTIGTRRSAPSLDHLEAPGSRAVRIGTVRHRMDARSHRHRTEPERLRQRWCPSGWRPGIAATVRTCVRELAIVRALVRLGGGRVRRTTERAPGLSEHRPAEREAQDRGARRRLGDFDRPASGARAPGSRVLLNVPLVTSAVSWWRGRSRRSPACRTRRLKRRYFSKLLMLTAAALLESGFTPESTSQANPAAMRASTVAVAALYSEIDGQGP